MREPISGRGLNSQDRRGRIYEMADILEGGGSLTNDEAALVLQGINKDRFRQILEKFGDRRLDLSHTILRKANFEGINCGDRIILDGADMLGAALDHSNFDRIRMCGTVLIRAVIYGSSFRDADLRKAVMYSIDAKEACFDGADLTDALLAGGNFSRASFVRAALSGVDFRASILIGADFDGATGLVDGQLDEAVLLGVRNLPANIKEGYLKNLQESWK